MKVTAAKAIEPINIAVANDLIRKLQATARDKEIPTRINDNETQDLPQKRYKAAFRGVTEADKKEFRDTKVLVPISVGQKYHEEGRLEAALKLINRSFKECTILVGDLLQRHSLKVFMQANTAEKAESLAKQQGDQWLSRNLKYISALSIPYKISKWDEWLSSKEYDYYHNSVRRIYDNDSEYKTMVNNAVNTFLIRAERNNDITGLDHCVDYVLEESAVTCLWVKAGFKFDVYPNGDNEAMKYAYKRLMKIHGYKYRSLSLNIKKL